MIQTILVIIRWVVSLWYAGWYLLWEQHSVEKIMGKSDPLWAYVVMAVGAIMLIVANFRKIRFGLNHVLVSLVLIHIAAWFTWAGNIKGQLGLLLISVIIYLLFYFTKGK